MLRQMAPTVKHLPSIISNSCKTNRLMLYIRFHDICTRTRLNCYGGHGYSHINKHVVPLMLERGWSEKNIEQLLVTNPENMLCYLN
jgi:predicted metal-dependent phosphotriesterase family hydrolase